MIMSSRRPWARVVAVSGAALLGAAALAGCASSSSSSSSTAASSSAASSAPAAAVTVADAWVREPLIPESTGAYATLSNTGSTELTLTGVTVPASAAMKAELHTVVMKDGKMEMVPVDKPLPIPAGGQLVLKPGSYHVMLMKPGALKIGDTVPLTFQLSDGTTVTADAPVKAPPPSASPTSS